MTLLITILIHTCLLGNGYLMALVLGIKNKIEAVGIAYLLGSGAVSLLFLLNRWLFGLALDGGNFVLSLVMVLAVCLLIIHRREGSFNSLIDGLKLSRPVSLEKIVSFENLLVTMLLIIFSYSFLQNYFLPITDWDSLALYDFRAKVIERTGEMSEGIELGYFFQYPPYTSFLHSFSYIFGIERAKVAYSFIYGSLLMGFYALLKRRQKKWVALLGALTLATDISIFEHSIIAYNNLAYLTFIALGLIYLWFWLLDSQKKDLLVGVLLVGLSTWVRASEPFWALAAVIILLKIFRERKQFRLGILSLLSLWLIYKFWGAYTKHLYVLYNDQVALEKKSVVEKLLARQHSVAAVIGNFKQVTLYFWENVLAVIRPLAPVLGLSVLADLYEKNKNNLLLLIVFLGLFVMIWAGTYVFSLFYDTWDLIGGSLQRVSMPLIPLACFLIFNNSMWNKKLIEKR